MWTSTSPLAPNLVDYNRARIHRLEDPLSFEIVAVTRIENPWLRERYLEVKALIADRRDVTNLPLPSMITREGNEILVFHGAALENIEKIIALGILPKAHPASNGATGSGDPGYFGSAHLGVYAGRCMNYVAKYSNGNRPLVANQTVDIIALKCCPGKEKYFDHHVGAIGRTPGYDSHVSGVGAEWWLPIPHQTLPCYVLSVRAVANVNRPCVMMHNCCSELHVGYLVLPVFVQSQCADDRL